jgi:hypothetical protein
MKNLYFQGRTNNKRVSSEVLINLTTETVKSLHEDEAYILRCMHRRQSQSKRASLHTESKDSRGRRKSARVCVRACVCECVRV